MWINYGKTFIELFFLDIFKKNNSHMQLMNEIFYELVKRENQ